MVALCLVLRLFDENQRLFPWIFKFVFLKIGLFFFNRWFVLTLAPDSERCFVSRVRVNDRDGSATTSAEDSC